MAMAPGRRPAFFLSRPSLDFAWPTGIFQIDTMAQSEPPVQGTASRHQKTNKKIGKSNEKLVFGNKNDRLRKRELFLKRQFILR